MTKQEAELMKVRLTRVWEPKRVAICKLDHRGMLKWNAQIQGQVFIDIELHFDFPEIHLYYESSKFWANLYLTSDNDIESDGNIKTDKRKAPKEDTEIRELIDQFAPQWMSLFRRCCWLLGCDIEATAHEKAEWIRGFTREEIETWNLQF